MQRFTLSVSPSARDAARLFVVSCQDDGHQLVRLTKTAGRAPKAGEAILCAMAVDWGGESNPLLATLPDEIEIRLDEDPETATLIALLRSEFTGERCGVGSVVSRLAEVLVVRILRTRIEAGSTEPGLLAGLSDPRLSRAIVAIHDNPGRDWTNPELAEVAGLSISRFAELFHQIVGEPPSSYLRKWRLTLARHDVMRGHRVASVARRYGYKSAEGFSRAFHKQFGDTPIEARGAVSGD